MRKLKVCLMVSGGFSSWPLLSLASFRSARSLHEFVDLRVVGLRAWKPGRRIVATLEYGGIRITELAMLQFPRTPALNVRIYRRLGWPFLRKILSGCDVVHSADAAGAGLLSSFWAQGAGARHVVQAIGSDVNSILPKLRARSAIAGWEKWVHGVSANSRALASLFRELYPEVRNVRTIYEGVDLKRFHPEGPRAGPLANRSPVRFIFLGGFPPYPALPSRTNTKGGETLMTAWRMAEASFRPPYPSLVIAGPCVDLEALGRWRASLRLPECVHIAGLLSPEDTPGYLRSADVVLLPSMQEGLPNVAMEASACGRAVFGSAVGGMDEVVVSGESGLTLPPGDVRRWSDALIEYSKKPSELRGMGDRARLIMERTFDADHYAGQMVDLYECAMKEPLAD